MNKADKKQYLLDNVLFPEDRAEKESLIEYLLDDMGDRDFDLEKVVIDLNNHRPIQYISNIAHFYGYKFYSDERALIPRPETEELVYQTVNYLKSRKETLTVLDIGTGTGVIPITTKLEYPNAIISAVDVSEDALSVAQINKDKHNVDVNFMKIDILSDESCKQLEQYDIIISNPPYIPYQEMKLMSANVLDHEPGLALFVEDHDPLIFYRRIVQLAKKVLKTKGVILFEINEYYSNEMTQMVNAENGHSVIIKDLQGKDRMMKIWF